MILVLLSLACQGGGDGEPGGKDSPPDDTAPLPTEECNGLDDDGDGAVDEGLATSTWYADADADGWGDDATTTTACEAPAGAVAGGGDCDDAVASVYPGATERCEGVDDNCDGRVDEQAEDAPTWYEDEDGDGWGDDRRPRTACAAPDGTVASGGDCADLDAMVHPDAPEACNGEDDDCDGEIDEGVTEPPLWYVDADGDGYGAPGEGVAACTRVPGRVPDATDCDDDLDVDGDGWGGDTTGVCPCEDPGAPYTVEVDGDCDEADVAVHPGAEDPCGDGLDTDCDGDDACSVADLPVIAAGPDAGPLAGYTVTADVDVTGDGVVDLVVGTDGQTLAPSAALLYAGPRRLRPPRVYGDARRRPCEEPRGGAHRGRRWRRHRRRADRRSGPTTRLARLERLAPPRPRRRRRHRPRGREQHQDLVLRLVARG